ncbi:MAG TPA: hypothetical protein VET26_02745 [Candidatus Sulfotelmatobacter sp.]|nr:hypothetical protein [Candidatus Sulfotelmatobacter sp.]
MNPIRSVRPLIVGFCLAAVALLPSAPVLADSSGWKVGYYTPSGRTLSNAETAPGSGIASFNFTDQPSTALLVTKHGSAKGASLGDLTGKTITATFEISGANTPFIYFGEPSCGTNNSTVRLFFLTSNAGGFDETHYWWSNPTSFVLSNTSSAITLTASLGDPSSWSDFFGHFGDDPGFPGFTNAVSNVTTIGLSFGGGCFFENGVGTVDGSGTFTLDSFDVG